MSLALGARLGSCEVLGRIGAGGMGEVFRARDLKLGREVALKVLPDAVAGQPERRARFEREARHLASLNHPHIATIYEVLETDAGVSVLVLELVDGETLDARIARGPLTLKESLTLAVQIAEALEAAHDRGILHRDLKPSNVKLTREGKAKLLDFGLAKAIEAGDGSADGGPVESSAATLTGPADATAAGAVVGTAPYMSPEQARGEALDKRTDVWAFGCVLYEMLSGRRAFAGATRTEATAAVLEREPDWAALPEETPVKVRDLLRRCLQKDRAERLRDIADARIELKEVQSDVTSGVVSSGSSTARRRRGRPWIAGGLVVAATLCGLGTWTWLRPLVSKPRAPRRLTVPLPPGVSLPIGNSPCPLALSPSGAQLVFVGVSARGSQLYRRDLDEIESRPISQTEGARGPFFSPDGRWLAFEQGGQLKKVRLDGGPPVPICDVTTLRGATWGANDTIVFTPKAWSGLWRISAGGGTPRQLTAPDETTDASHRWPQVLPGADAAVFTFQPNSLRLDESRIGLVALETGQVSVVLEGGAFARYVSSGHLVYARDGALLAVPFDPTHPRVAEPGTPVLDDVRMDPLGMSVAHFDVSPAGSLAYVPGYPRPIDRSLLWVDRQGRRQPVTETRSAYVETALSPDGRRVAATRQDATSTNLWVLDLTDGTWRRLTSGKNDRNPVWSPDGTRLAFSSNREGAFNLYQIPADGSGAPERLTTSHLLQTPSGWSPDGQVLAFNQQDPETNQDIWMLALNGERQPRPLVVTVSSDFGAVFSPDGRWLAYASNDSGRMEVYVRPFPGPGPRWQVSREGGVEPRWAQNGREIFYRSGGKRPKLMSVAVDVRSTLRAGIPVPLFDDSFAGGAVPANVYAIAPDGQRFLMIEQPDEAPAPNQIVVIPDFAGELREKFRTARR